MFRKEQGLGSFDKRLDQLCAENQELQNKIDGFEEKLVAINNTIDSRMKETTEILSKLLLWMKKYGSVLDAIDKENEKLFGREAEDGRPD